MIELSVYSDTGDVYPKRRELTRSGLTVLLTRSPSRLEEIDGPSFGPGLYLPGVLREPGNVHEVSFLLYAVEAERLFDEHRQVFLSPLHPTHPSPDGLLEYARTRPQVLIDTIIARAPFPGLVYSSIHHGWSSVTSLRMLLFPSPRPLTPVRWRFLWRLVFDLLGGRDVGMDPSYFDPSTIARLPARSRLAQDLGLPTPFVSRFWREPSGSLPPRHVLEARWRQHCQDEGLS